MTVGAAVGVMLMLIITCCTALYLWYAGGELREQIRAANAAAAGASGSSWFCDGGALLYPSGPNSTPICVAYTPAKKL